MFLEIYACFINDINADWWWVYNLEFMSIHDMLWLSRIPLTLSLVCLSWVAGLAIPGSDNSVILRAGCFLDTTIFVSPALAGKRDHVVRCSCYLLVSVVKKRVNIWLYLPHALMDFNQSWVIDATWEPSFVEVKGHISRSKVIWGQLVR